MLKLESVEVQIEGVQVLRGVSLTVPAGGTVALIGRNGAGKTTTLRSIMGLVRKERGDVFVDGRSVSEVAPFRRPAMGIGFAPEDRRLFGTLSVEENLLLPLQAQRVPATTRRERLAEVYDLLPELNEFRGRKAGSLSGGQQKIVALGRALMIGNQVVLLDEPFQGLAPALARRYAEALVALRQRWTELAVLITESNPSLLSGLAQQTYRIERGEVSLVSGGRDY